MRSTIKSKNNETKKEDQIKKSFDDDFLVQFPWAGNLGLWKWYYKENKVEFNHKKMIQIGYDPDIIGEIGFEFFTSKLHPDDYERVMDNMKNHLLNITPAYEVEYRIEHKDGKYLWYYDRGKVTKRDDKGVPLLIEGIVFDISEAKKIEQQLIDLSQKDELTKVYNRRTFYQMIDVQINKFKADKIPFSLVMFDIDHFKNVNDTFGHLAGDDVLVKLTETIMNNKRKDDHLFRYGGEEFFMLLPNTNLSEAIVVASRKHQIIKNIGFGKVGRITVSMGVVTYLEDETLDQLITRVDNLMYSAKHAGRNQIKY